MNELVSLEQLKTEIKFYEQQTVSNYIEIGKRLKKIKEHLPHGEWLDWIEKNLDYKKSTVYNLIAVAEELTNFHASGNLSFKKLVALTTVSEEDRETIQEHYDLEEMSTREVENVVKIYKEKQKEMEEELQVLKEANQMLSEELLKKETVTEVVEKVVEKVVVPDDYSKTLEDNALYRQEIKEHKAKNKKLNDELVAFKENIGREHSTAKEKENQLVNNLINFKFTILNANQKLGGNLGVLEYIHKLPHQEKMLLQKASKNLLGLASSLYDTICEECEMFYE